MTHSRTIKLSEASAGEREGNAEMTDFGLLLALLSSDATVSLPSESGSQAVKGPETSAFPGLSLWQGQKDSNPQQRFWRTLPDII